LDSLEFANELQGIVINDIYNEVIPQLQQQIAYLDTLNRRKINVLQNRIDNLHSADSVIVDVPNENLIGNISSKADGWTDNGDGSYYYDAVNDYQYLIFNLKEPLRVGETCVITYDIETVNDCRINLWLYAVDGSVYPSDWPNPSISEALIYNSGSYVYEYTVTHLDRARFGIRARNWFYNK